jgi:hypothetical protein
MNESIIVDLANPESPYYTDQEKLFKRIYIRKTKAGKRRHCIYYTKIGTTDEKHQ